MFSAHPFFRAGTVAAALAITAIGASAATYDFESVTPPPFTGQAVPAGYAGATWTGLFLRRTSEAGLQGAGFVLNGTTMVLADDVAPSITFAVPTVYAGAFIGNSALGATPNISYDLFLSGGLVASSGPIGATGAFLPSISGSPIDRIVFHVANTNRFSMDALQVSSAVPEANASLMLLAGLAVVGGLVRRRDR